MDLLMRKRSLFLPIVSHFQVTRIYCNAMLLKVKLIAGVSVKGVLYCMKEEWRKPERRGKRVCCGKDGQEGNQRENELTSLHHLRY